MEPRLPAQLEVSALIRQVQAAGGFSMVLSKGEPDAGTILVVLTQGGRGGRAYERMPSMDGARTWHCAKRQEAGAEREFDEYVARRGQRDPDLWVVELDVADGERLIGVADAAG